MSKERPDGIGYAKDGGTLTQTRLREVLDYDKNTGIFRWRASLSGRSKLDAIAGTVTEHGYRMIRIDRLAHYAHRLAWLYVNGEWASFLDHVDMNGDNNAISNLRVADKRTNAWNKNKIPSVSNYIGVWPAGLKWVAVFERKSCGLFHTPEQAAVAWDEVCRKKRGPRGRYNFPREGEWQA